MSDQIIFEAKCIVSQMMSHDWIPVTNGIFAVNLKIKKLF
jgi:hypothetical protein